MDQDEKYSWIIVNNVTFVNIVHYVNVVLNGFLDKKFRCRFYMAYL